MQLDVEKGGCLMKLRKIELQIIQQNDPTLCSLSELERSSFVFQLLNNIKILSRREEINETRKEEK